MMPVRPVWLENVMIEHPNSFLVHHCLQAANVGDRQTLRALWAPDIVWHVKGTGPLRGDIKGADNVLEFLAQMGDFGGQGLQTEIRDVMISHRRAAVICHAYGEWGDRVLDADFLVIADIMGRRIQELTTIPVDPDRVMEFWAV
jgi:ketosteroid isomerase-like protein